MARNINRLSPAAVKHAKAGMHADGGGLWLQVTAGEGSKLRRSWIFRFGAGGRERKMGLGSLDTVSLSEAREKATECRRLRVQGIDPIEQRDADRAQQRAAAVKSLTFDRAVDRYITAHQAGWRNTKHAAQWRNTLKAYAAPVFGALPVQAVDVTLVMKVLDPIWTTKPETASRVRGRIESVLDWAAARGLRKGENPARWRGHLDKLLPARGKVRRVRHHPALPYAEIGDFMTDLRAQQGVAARALEFTILTASRTGEVIGARWEEFDFKARTWIVPGERMKSGREHRVPLSGPAVAILQGLHATRSGDHAFPGDRKGKPLSSMAMLMLLRRMGRGGLTVHGFRSTFRDWCAESTSFPREVAEAALAHVLSDKTEAAYQRGDLFEKRRRLMGAWEIACGRPARGAKVVPIRRTAKP